MSLSSWARVEQVTASGRAEIGAQRIYILPTRYGMIYATLVFLMLLGAVNYGNNPAHLLTFLLAGAVAYYTLLTIGDGLVSQIPALIIATSAGVLSPGWRQQ